MSGGGQVSRRLLSSTKSHASSRKTATPHFSSVLCVLHPVWKAVGCHVTEVVLPILVHCTERTVGITVDWECCHRRPHKISLWFIVENTARSVEKTNWCRLDNLQIRDWHLGLAFGQRRSRNKLNAFRVLPRLTSQAGSAKYSPPSSLCASRDVLDGGIHIRTGTAWKRKPFTSKPATCCAFGALSRRLSCLVRGVASGDSTGSWAPSTDGPSSGWLQMVRLPPRNPARRRDLVKGNRHNKFEQTTQNHCTKTLNVQALRPQFDKYHRRHSLKIISR